MALTPAERGPRDSFPPAAARSANRFHRWAQPPCSRPAPEYASLAGVTVAQPVNSSHTEHDPPGGFSPGDALCLMQDPDDAAHLHSVFLEVWRQYTDQPGPEYVARTSHRPPPLASGNKPQPATFQDLFSEVFHHGVLPQRNMAFVVHSMGVGKHLTRW